MPLMAFFTMSNVRFVAPLIGSHVCLLPSGIYWQSMRARGRQKRFAEFECQKRGVA
jgi:hypothetical protein